MTDEITKDDFLQKKGFPEGVKIFKEHLAIAGHSVGGVTAFKSGLRLDKIKAVIGQDSSF